MDPLGAGAALQVALGRLAVLADAGAALASTMDERARLQRISRVLAGRVVDWCALDVVTDGGGLERVAAAARGAESAGYESLFPLDDRHGPLARVLRGGGTQLLSAADVVDLATSPGALTASLLDGGAPTAIITPLAVRRGILGALTMARGAGPPLDVDEVALSEEVARFVALAVENSRLHEQTIRIAEQMQRSLLPELPTDGPFELDARYTPAEAEADVGGDWYDAFELPQGDTALIIGDVAGHDLKAAVTMSHVRNMLRGISCDREEPPGLILRRLDVANEVLYPGMTTTCIYALVKGESPGPWQLEYACAGHPPPLLVTADGNTEYLQGGRGPLLGARPETERQSATFPLPPRSTLLLYTDGLIERRGDDLDHGFTRLRQHAAALARHPLGDMCDELLAAQGSNTNDDTALLALRVPNHGSE
jgi:phosphoserine phosphatase RsbU/P